MPSRLSACIFRSVTKLPLFDHSHKSISRPNARQRDCQTVKEEDTQKIIVSWPLEGITYLVGISAKILRILVAGHNCLLTNDNGQTKLGQKEPKKKSRKKNIEYIFIQLINAFKMRKNNTKDSKSKKKAH